MNKGLRYVQLFVASFSLMVGMFVSYLVLNDMFFCEPGSCGATGFFYLPAFFIFAIPLGLVMLSCRKAVKRDPAGIELDHKDVKTILWIARVALIAWLSPLLGIALLLLFESFG